MPGIIWYLMTPSIVSKWRSTRSSLFSPPSLKSMKSKTGLDLYCRWMSLGPDVDTVVDTEDTIKLECSSPVQSTTVLDIGRRHSGRGDEACRGCCSRTGPCSRRAGLCSRPAGPCRSRAGLSGSAACLGPAGQVSGPL